MRKYVISVVSLFVLCFFTMLPLQFMVTLNHHRTESTTTHVSVQETGLKLTDTGKRCKGRRTVNITSAEKEKRKNDYLEIPLTYNERCPRRFAVTFPNNKGMGNTMSEYTHIIGFCQRYMCDPYIPNNNYEKLKYMFPNIRLPTTDYLKRCGTKFETKSYNEVTMLLLKYGSVAVKKNYILYNLVGGYVDYANYYEKVKGDFTIRKDIKASALQVIKNIKERYQTDTVVGVHVRRTDYITFLRQRTKGYLLGNPYYLRSFSFFKSRFPNAVFAVISDDVAWCKENFNNTDYVIEYPGTGNYSAPFFDFALLASCSHSVFGVGTFGYWASFLAGGLVTYPINFAGNKGCDPVLPMIETQNFLNWYPILGNTSQL